MLPLICEDQGWMIELVLNEHVYVLWQPKPKVICQVRAIIPPGQRDDLHVIALRAQVPNYFAIIQIAAAQRIQRAVENKPNPHVDTRFAGYGRFSS